MQHLNYDFVKRKKMTVFNQETSTKQIQITVKIIEMLK